MSTPGGRQETFEETNSGGRRASERDLDRFVRRATRALADIGYFSREHRP